jgi:ABC-2 type transport system permease protein
MNHGQIRACGTMTELQSLIGSVEKYRIDAHKLSKAVALEIAVKDPEIKVNIKSDHHVTFEFDYNDADYRLEDVIREIFKKGGKILGISRDQIPLSTIFSHLTGENCVEVQEMPIISRSTGSEEKTQPAPSKNAAKTNSSNPIKTEDKNSPKTFVRRLNSFKHIVFALVKRDMLSETSYRLSFCMQIVETFLTICALFFLSRMLGQDTINHYLKPYGGDYFIFAIIGVGFFKYFNVGFSSFANKLRTEQMSGTLEAMLSSPAPLSLIVLGGSVWEFIMTTFRVGIFLVAGAFIGESSLSGGNYLLAVLILFLMVGSAASFGIISSCFIMVVKRGDPIGWLFRSSSFLLGGVLFPVTVLPDWMQNLALFIPTTHALKAMRMALLQGHSITQLLPEIGSLCVFCFGLLPLSLVVLRYSVRLAKKDGTLTHY